MGSEGRRTVRSPQAEFRSPQAKFRCPSCGRPVGTVIKRRKTLGAFVPFWGPGPCHHRACERYVPPEEVDGAQDAASAGGAAGAQGSGGAPQPPGESPGTSVGTN
ncbi:hypothetical protein ACH41E_21465 [Streptomyces sp. NPDC020412]|uniref:hypothetical protein n=1 Tax=Streptomyces sp. NPDC020412 TaxID=3365073 RepID=UPI0037AD2C2A